MAHARRQDDTPTMYMNHPDSTRGLRLWNLMDPYRKIVGLFAAVSFLCGSTCLVSAYGSSGADVTVELAGSKGVRNLGVALLGYSRAQQMIGAAEERNGQIQGLEIRVAAHGASNAGKGLGAYAKAIEKVGVIASQSIQQDQLQVDLHKDLQNAAAAVAGYADAEQNIGYMAGNSLTRDTVTVNSASQIVNAAGTMASHSKAVQDIGTIEADTTPGGAGAQGDQVTITGSEHSSIVNSAEAIASQAVAKQKLGAITASGVGNKVAVTVEGNISNAANSLAASVEADQDIGVMRGVVDRSRINLDLEGGITNVGGGIAASVKARQEIGIIDPHRSGQGDHVQLTLDKGATISNAASGYVGSGTVTQIVGGVYGDEVTDSSVLIEKMGSVYNFGRGVVGKGSSSQHIGVIDMGTQSGSSDHITLNMGNVSGSGSGIAGSGKVWQDIGVLKAAGHDNRITVTTGDISGATLGIVGKGVSHETVGAILGKRTVDSSVTVTTGNIVTSAQGSGTEADIDVGVLHGDAAQAQQLTVKTGSITAEAVGVDSRAVVMIGVIDSSADVKTVPPDHITVGSIHNKNESVSATTVIEVGHVYADAQGPVSMGIKTGNLSIDAKALGVPYQPGIQIGNVKGAGKASVNVTTGDINLDPYCIDWHGYGVCFGTALVRIGNHNIGDVRRGWDL